MSKSIELSFEEACRLLRACHQAFIRSEEVCARSYAPDAGYKPEPGFIQLMIDSMRETYDVAFKVGEHLKTYPDSNHEVIDSLVTIDGRWEKVIKQYEEKLSKS